MRNLTVILSPDNFVTTYSKTVLTKNDSDTFQLATHVDGNPAKNVDTGQKFVDDETLQAEINETNSAIEKNKQSNTTDTAQPEGVAEWPHSCPLFSGSDLSCRSLVTQDFRRLIAVVSGVMWGWAVMV